MSLGFSLKSKKVYSISEISPFAIPEILPYTLFLLANALRDAIFFELLEHKNTRLMPGRKQNVSRI